jgi:hypothetical protein
MTLNRDRNMVSIRIEAEILLQAFKKPCKPIYVSHKRSRGTLLLFATYPKHYISPKPADIKF